MPAVHLVGHSMGALIGLDLAARHPDRIAGLALLGAAPRMPVHPALLEAAARPEPLAAELICDWGFGPAGHFGGHKAPGSWMLGHALRLLGASSGPRLHTDLAACDAYQDGLEAAAKLRCPTLIVAGAADRMTPARQAAKLAEAIKGARLVTLPACGHMMMVEQPDATLDALVGVLRPQRSMMPPLWPGATVALLGGGPSLTLQQIEYVRGRCRIIAINRAYRLVSEADWLHAADKSWWRNIRTRWPSKASRRPAKPASIPASSSSDQAASGVSKTIRLGSRPAHAAATRLSNLPSDRGPAGSCCSATTAMVATGTKVTADQRLPMSATAWSISQAGSVSGRKRCGDAQLLAWIDL